MPIGTISLSYTTNKFPISKVFDTRVNVKDTIEYLRFSTVFSENGVGLSYIDAPKISIEENVLIEDIASFIPNNTKKLVQETEYLTDKLDLEFASFYITDIVVMDEGQPVPLYLRHNITAQNISNLEVLDSSLQSVDPTLWLYCDETSTLGYEQRSIYTNLVCKIDKRSDSYEAYYVRYRNNDTKEIVIELLDSKPFYSQSSFLSERNRREYTINETSSGYNVNVIFDSLNYSPTPLMSVQRYFIKSRNKSKIYIEKPAAISSAQRWNLRISPGDFNYAGRRYWVPEYYTQMYSPNFPYKLEKEREALILEDKLLYTDLFPIADLQISGFYIYIILKDKNNTVHKAITNDPDADTYVTKQGFITDIFYEKDFIESVSSNSGFIKLKEPIDTKLKAYITYRYIEDFFTYLDLSVNPSINPDILGKKIVMYNTPENSTRAVHHLIVNESNTILNSSQTDLYRTFEGFSTGGSVTSLIDSTLPENDYFTGFELEILSGINSGIKLKITSYNKLSKTIGLADALPYPIGPGTQYRILKKLEDYTRVEPRLNKTYTYTGWNTIANANAYLNLGNVFVTQNLNISDIKSYDSRILGGGIKEDREEAALQLQDEARWYWDIGNFDGTAYPGMGALLVELPRSILKELGGPFEREQVKEIVQRHAASGAYPVIKYYDISTEITDIEPGDGSVSVTWELIDASEYNIYIGNSPDNVFLYQTQPGTRNAAVINGLENNKIYYIQIEPIVGGQARLRSRTISFMPFNYSSTLPPVKYGEGLFSEGSYE